MTWYDFLLFVHVSMAVIWVGGSTIMQFFGLRALRASDPMRLVDLGQDIEWIGSRVLLPASGIAVLSGVLMVVDSDFWGFGDDWILLGILLFAVTFFAGALFFGPESGRLGRLTAAEGPTSPAVQAKLQRLLALTRADLMLLFLIIFDMAVKPEWGDASLWIAVLVFAALAVLLVRHGMNARLAVVSAPAAE